MSRYDPRKSSSVRVLPFWSVSSNGPPICTSASPRRGAADIARARRTMRQAAGPPPGARTRFLPAAFMPPISRSPSGHSERGGGVVDCSTVVNPAEGEHGGLANYHKEGQNDLSGN